MEGYWFEVEDWDHGEVVVVLVAGGAEGIGVLKVCEGADGADEIRDGAGG